jgi:hypothetical protein
VLPWLTLQVGPQESVAGLAAGQKTDVVAIALVGADARYEVVCRVALWILDFPSGVVWKTPGSERTTR